MIELNGQQLEASKLLKAWWKGDRQIFELAGFAGTGKSTIINTVVQDLDLKKGEVLYVSFTGKAVQVLNRKGMFAKTIHSTFYRMEDVAQTDEEGKPLIMHGRIQTKPEFVKVDSINPKIRCIIIDEGGCVGRRLAVDILSFNIKTIVLGDLNQLPPVLDAQYFLKDPDYNLTQIMRQAEDDPIVYLSKRAMEGRVIEYGRYGDKCFVVEPEEINDETLMKADMILAATNRRREEINNDIKGRILGRDLNTICYNDKLICRQNDWNLKVQDDLYLINGSIGYVTDLHKESMPRNGATMNIDFKLDFLMDDISADCFNNVCIDLNYYKSNFEERKTYGRSFGSHKFEDGNCITVHLSQGSEYKNVIYFMDKIGSPSFQNRVNYTAFTRAEEGLVVARAKPKYYYPAGF